METDRDDTNSSGAGEQRTGQLASTRWHGRQIGPWGSAARGVAAAAAIAWAVAPPHNHPWLNLPLAASKPWGILIGVAVAPVVLTLAMRLRGRAASPLHLGKGPALAVTILTLLAMQFYPVAVIVAIGFPLLVQAVIGRAGCEVLTIPNLVLRRHDYLFCLPFSPIDGWERSRRR